MIDIIDKGAWGNTAEEAAAEYVIHKVGKAVTLQVVCRLLEATIPAELPVGVEALIRQVNKLSAASGDVIQLMEAIPPLVSISRYGNVRKTDAEMVTGIVTGMITRICLSLSAAWTAVADDTALHLLDLFFKLNEAVNILQQADVTGLWQHTLPFISQGKNTAPVIAGYSTRLLVDRKLLDGEQLHRAFYYAMSQATAPATAAAWLEGF